MKPFDVEELLSAARQRTGLSDFGPPDFMEGLNSLVSAINTEARIADNRRDALYERFMRLLTNRLWFAKDVADHPEILDEDVGSPIIISCLPRTASSKLHRMLGASGDFQFVPMWQGHNFARIPGLPDGGREKRITEGRAYEKWMYETSPATLQGHAMFTKEPEEDILLGEFTLRHTMLVGLFDTPSYAQWVMQADSKPTYDYLQQQIKYLQWQASPHTNKPWLMKTPCHFGNESQLQRIYKKPRFIITHRDPARCMPSIIGVAVNMCKLYSDHHSDASVGAGVSQLFAQSAFAHMKWREQADDAQILDLGYDEINRKGMDTMQKVYDYFGMTLSARAEAAMQKWEQINFAGKHSHGSYSAEAINTTEREIRETFRPYMERFSEFM